MDEVEIDLWGRNTRQLHLLNYFPNGKSMDEYYGRTAVR